MQSSSAPVRFGSVRGMSQALVRGCGEHANSSLLASWASLNGVPDTTDTTDTHRQLFRPKPALSHRNRHHHPSPVPGAMAFHRNADVGRYRVIDGVDVAVVHCSPSAITECGCGSCRSGGFRACCDTPERETGSRRRLHHGADHDFRFVTSALGPVVAMKSSRICTTAVGDSTCGKCPTPRSTSSRLPGTAA